MWRCFTATPDYITYTALPSNVNLADKNTVNNILAERSVQFDFSKEDRTPYLECSEVIWKGVKG